MRSSDARQRALLDGREDALQVADDAVSHLGVLDHLPEDEQHEEREREQRQDEVVGDHRREAGDVLAVGAVPEDAEEAGGRMARNRRGPRHGHSRSSGFPLQRLDRPARQPHPERRRLGRRRDPGPREVLDPAATLRLRGRGALGRRLGGGLGPRLRGRRLRRRLRGRGLAFGAAAFGFVVFVALADDSLRRRGLRVPGRESGRLPNTLPGVSSASGFGRVLVAHPRRYSSAIGGRARCHRRNSGDAGTVFMAIPHACMPACGSRTNAPQRLVHPLTSQTTPTTTRLAGGRLRRAGPSSSRHRPGRKT